MRARINELLTIARLPAALWTSIHGGREHFDNPGSSVMSFCARWLGCEYIELPGHMEDTVTQCREFSTKREHLQVIIELLDVRATALTERANLLDHDAQKAMFVSINDMVKLSEGIKGLKSAFEVNGTMPSRLDASSQVYPLFSQAILDLHWSEVYLEENIARYKPAKA